MAATLAGWYVTSSANERNLFERVHLETTSQLAARMPALTWWFKKTPPSGQSSGARFAQFATAAFGH